MQIHADVNIRFQGGKQLFQFSLLFIEYLHLIQVTADTCHSTIVLVTESL